MSVLGRWRRRSAGLLAVAILGALTACSSGSGGPAPSGPAAPAAAPTGNVVELSGADPKALGGGRTIKVGINVALSGQGAYFGKTMVNGAQLAADQIKAAGGPDFQLVIKDHKSGDAQAGVQTTRELGQEGVHYALYSYIGVLGSAFQGIEQNKILALDGGGGTQKFGQRKPYFYGSRAQPPNDVFPGVAEYLATAMPDVRTAAMIIGDTGAENVADSTAIARTSLAAKGIQLADVEVVTYGGTDFSSAVTKLANANPGVVISAQFGSDTGYFLKQLRAAGSDVPVIGTDYIPDTAAAAGAAATGFMFAADYFDADNPRNDWARYFTDSYRFAHPDLAPDYYAANYYEDMFTLWQVVQRVTAQGGDVENPDQILAAFTSNLTFPSVYGTPSSGRPYGTYTFDPTTHTLTSRPMGVYEFDGTAVKQLAGFNIGGADFAVTN